MQRNPSISTPGAPETGESSQHVPMEQIRSRLHEALQDCKDIRTQRVIYDINLAKTPAALRLLLGDVQDCIAKVHCPTVAIERIDKLFGLFGNCLPGGRPARIQG